MAGDWQRLLRGREFAVDGATVLVHLGQRSHKVTVAERDESYEFSAVVVGASKARGISKLSLRAWLRNRAAPLVGFRVDQRERLVAEAWVPKAGLTADEFRLYARTVARESDRFEFELTGEDVE